MHHVHLNCSNYSYYALHPRSTELSKRDQKKALYSSIFMGFCTIGIAYGVCAIYYKINKTGIDSSRSAAYAHQTALRTISRVSPVTYIVRTSPYLNPKASETSTTKSNGLETSINHDKKDLKEQDSTVQMNTPPLIELPPINTLPLPLESSVEKEIVPIKSQTILTILKRENSVEPIDTHANKGLDPNKIDDWVVLGQEET